MQNRKTKINLSKIIPGAVVGLLAGASFCAIKEITSLGSKQDAPLDPPAPNMEEVNYEMANDFRAFMGSFYKLCPGKNVALLTLLTEVNRKNYRRYVSDAISYAESVMIIENQLRRNELKSYGLRERSEAQANAELCMKELRKAKDCFYSHIMFKVSDKVERVQLKLAESITNINNMSS